MIAAVRASQDLGKAALPLVARYVFAPASWPLTALALRCRISPNAVTAFRAVLALLAVAATAFTLWGAALFAACAVLDHVDGSLCRMQDRATYFGKFIDGLADMAADLMLLPALALHCAVQGGPAWAGAAAALGTAGLAVAFLALYRLPLLEMQAHVAARPSRGALGLVDAHAANALFDIRYAALAPLLALGAPVTILFLGALYLLAGTALAATRTARASGSLRIHRRSRSAA